MSINELPNCETWETGTPFFGIPAKFVTTEDGGNQENVNAKTVKFVDSIADLVAINNPKDGDVVFVKGYYKATNFALAQPFTGGGTRIYIDSQKNENDNFICINGWVLQIKNKTVSPEQGGAKGDLSQDDAPVIRNIIEKIGRLGGGTIEFTQKYLLSSYRSNDSTDIFDLWPNITFKGFGDSHLYVGNGFHSKSVIVFNNPWFLTTPLSNVHFKNMRITSDIANNNMGSDFHLRIGVHFQSALNCSFTGGSIDNFDCQNAILSGWIDYNGYSGTVGADLSDNVTIDDVTFDNLAYGSINEDHSTCYILSKNSVVKNCRFYGSAQTRLVGCPTELHNSHTTFRDNFVIGYSRGVWLSCQEKPNITDLLVQNNRFFIANHMTIISAENGSFSNSRVLDNYCECEHKDGTPALYVGRQGLLITSIASYGSEATGFEYSGNTVKIVKSADPTLATAFSASFFMTDFNIHDNTFIGAKSFIVENTSLNSWKINDNDFLKVITNENTFGVISNASGGEVSGFQFNENTFEYEYGSAPQYTLSIDNTNSAFVGSSVCKNKYPKNNPQTSEVYFSSSITDLSISNKFDFIHFKCSGSYSSSTAGGMGLLTIQNPYPKLPFRTQAEIVYSPVTENLLSGVSNYHGDGSIKIPFYTELISSGSSHNDFSVRLKSV